MNTKPKQTRALLLGIGIVVSGSFILWSSVRAADPDFRVKLKPITRVETKDYPGKVIDLNGIRLGLTKARVVAVRPKDEKVFLLEENPDKIALFPGAQIQVRAVMVNESPNPVKGLIMGVYIPTDIFTLTAQDRESIASVSGAYNEQTKRAEWIIDPNSKGEISKTITLTLAENIDPKIEDITLVGITDADDLAFQKLEKQTYALWNSITGKLIVQDHPGKDYPQPLVGVQLSAWVSLYDGGPGTAFKKIKSATDKPNEPGRSIVADKDGKYLVYFKRNDTVYKERTQDGVSLHVTYRTTAEKMEDEDRDFGLVFLKINSEKELTSPPNDPISVETKLLDIDKGSITKDLIFRPLIGQKNADFDYDTNSEYAISAASVWKNMWLTLSYIEDDMGQVPAGRWDRKHPERVFFVDASQKKNKKLGTHALLSGDGFVLAADTWQFGTNRIPQNAELHEFAHNILTKAGNRYSRAWRDNITALYLSSLSRTATLNGGGRVAAGLTKIPELNPYHGFEDAGFGSDRISLPHYGWVNDATSISTNEAFATFFGAWMDREINGVRATLCDSCYSFDISGKSQIPLSMALTPSSAGMDYTKKSNGNGLTEIVQESGFPHEERAIASLLMQWVVGVKQSSLGMTSANQRWIKQEDGNDFKLYPWARGTDLAAEKSRMKHLLDILVNWKKEDLHIDELIIAIEPNADQTLASPSLATIALANGMFQDTDCDSRFDRTEKIGVIAHDQGFAVRLNDYYDNGKVVKTTVGARPWRGQSEAPFGTRLDLKLTNQAGQVKTEPQTVTIAYRFAAPFEDESYQYTFVSTGDDSLNLLVPPPAYRTMLTIEIGDNKTPVLAMDSVDFYARYTQDVLPESLGTLTVNVDQPTAVTVPTFPANYISPAAIPAIEYAKMVANDPATTQSVVQPKAVDPTTSARVVIASQPATPSATPSSTSSISPLPLSSPITSSGEPQLKVEAGSLTTVTVANLAAPQTISLTLNDNQLLSRQNVAVAAETTDIAVAIPDWVTPGNHILTITEESGTKIELSINVEANETTVAAARQKKQQQVAAIILLVLGLVVIRFFPRRSAGGLAIIAVAWLAATSATSTQAELGSNYPYLNRRSDFVQLVPADLENPEETTTKLYRMNDWNDANERLGYFSRVETGCFVQRLADHWQRVQPNQVLTINDLSLWKGGVYANPATGVVEHSTHQEGFSIDLWSEPRTVPRQAGPIRTRFHDITAEGRPVWLQNPSGAYNYDSAMAEQFIRAIYAAYTDVHAKNDGSFPTVYFNPPPGANAPSMKIGTATFRTQESSGHENHWHIELPPGI